MTQQNTQAVVLQQPTDQMIRLDLQHSTDTTAIWSFVIAMVVAFILGVSATIIAIWYGRKSFKLTEMSFKTVVEEIKASQQSAIDLNTKLFEQQQNLLKIQIKAQFEENILIKVREYSAQYNKIAETLNIEQRVFLENLDLSNKEIIKSAYDKIIILLNELRDSSYKLDAYLHRQVDSELTILTEKKEIDAYFAMNIHLCLKMIHSDEVQSNDLVLFNYKEYDKKIDNLKLLFEAMLLNRVNEICK